MRPPASATMRESSVRRTRSQARKAGISRSKRAHHSACSAGKASSGAKACRPKVAQRGLGIRRERLGIGLREIAQRFMHRAAALGRTGGSVEPVERAQLQYVARIDGIGIAQPGLDLGDAEHGRAQLDSRRRRRPGDARGGRVGIDQPGEPAEALAAHERLAPAHFAAHRRQPLEEARGHGRRTADLGGAGEDEFRRAAELREVVGGQADAPLRRLQPERRPHRPAEPGIGAHRRRPAILDQTRQHHAIDRDETGFQRTEDAQPGGGVERRAHRPGGEQIRQGRRIVG